MLRKSLNIGFILALIAISIAACTSRKMGEPSSALGGKIDFEQVLTWLPADSETLLVANGPFWMSNFQTGQKVYTNHEVTRQELEKHFQG